MRIGLLTTSYPRVPGDYAGSFVGDRVAALVAEGHVVEVLAAADATAAEVLAPDVIADREQLRTQKVSVTRLPATVAGCDPLFYRDGAPETLERGGAGAYLAAARFSAALAAAARARATRWDVIESHWLVPSALAALAAAPELPRRAYAHSGDVALLERLPLGRTMARLLVRGGTELRFVSAELRERFAALAGGAVGTVVPLAAPSRLFPRRGGGPDPVARRHLGLRGPTLLAVGRLVSIKGHAALLRACALLEAERRGAPSGRVGGGRRAEGWVRDRLDDDAVVVVILGDGPERQRLSELALELGVRLRMPGFVARGEVSRWLSAADVYVQPSVRLANGRAEGAPLATAEARAVGIPVVVESDPAGLAQALRNVTAV